MVEDQPDKKRPVGGIPLDLQGAEDVPMTYADAVFVNYAFEDLSIAFFQTTRPIIKTAEEAAALESLPARCMVRVVLSPSVATRLRDFLDLNIQQRAAVLQQKKMEP